MSHTKASASIVVYNGADEAILAAKSLLEHTKDVSLQIYLIDNKSPDNSAKLLKEARFDADVQVICLDENIGFGSGHNTVLPMLDSDYHFIVNPDITLNEDAVSKLCNWLDRHGDVVMAAPRLAFPNGEEQYTAKRVPTFMALLARQLHIFKGVEKRYRMLDEDLSKPQEIQFCTGCFNVIRTEVFKAIGGFDESYFMYVEDADITRRAMKMGKVMYVPQVCVTHAWHRDANKKWKNFWMQIKSMFHYWKIWGFKFI